MSTRAWFATIALIVVVLLVLVSVFAPNAEETAAPAPTPTATPSTYVPAYRPGQPFVPAATSTVTPSAASSPLAQDSPRPVATISVSESVREGCASAALYDEMINALDIDGLERLGPGLMVAMVTTGDAGLDVMGGNIALKMTMVSEPVTMQELAGIREGFGGYLEWCQFLLED